MVRMVRMVVAGAAHTHPDAVGGGLHLSNLNVMKRAILGNIQRAEEITRSVDCDSECSSFRNHLWSWSIFSFTN